MVELDESIKIPDGYTAGPIRRIFRGEDYISHCGAVGTWLDDEPTHGYYVVLTPKPKWRPATLQDLANATKPIPCRMRDYKAQEWHKTFLCGYAMDANFRWQGPNGSYWRYCDIPDK